MSNNKCPGIDGIPVEFYKVFWCDIKEDMKLIFKSVLKSNLGTSQNKGVITLISKGANDELLDNWRPISLLCSDYKILAKLLAKRLTLVLNDIISVEQFCIPKRSINTCNILMRDVIYYCNDNKFQSAVINLDWSKAFDRVDMRFVFKVLEKMGMSPEFLSYIKLLYEKAESCCLINGNLGRYFKLERGVRQGCPLSMLLYVIFQEPLYRALNMANEIKPLLMPNGSKLKMLGYADDTNVFVVDEESIVYLDSLLRKFESATGCMLNRTKKTKVFGIGIWDNKKCWPLSWLKVETGVFTTLGISYSNSYIAAVDHVWSNQLEKVRTIIRTLYSRDLTLYQRVIIVNSLVCSKLCYLGHVYPLPPKYSK